MLQTFASWHPFIVHFAVAFTMGSVVFDVIDFLRGKPSFERTGFMLMSVAIPFLLAAVFTGNLAHGFIHLPEKAHLIDMHEQYANISVWLFTAAGLWRVFMHFKGQYHGLKKIAYVFIVAAAAMSVFLTARKGGEIRHPGYSVVEVAITSHAVLTAAFTPERCFTCESL